MGDSFYSFIFSHAHVLGFHSGKQLVTWFLVSSQSFRLLWNKSNFGLSRWQVRKLFSSLLTIKMASKRVTQETFDEVVQENITEFDMDPEEAVREAVEQFESQGTANEFCSAAVG